LTPACTVCGYAVDFLRSCYSSNWKLFKGSSQLTPGRYFFNPGAPHYPAPHNLGSANWTSQERDPPPLLGEQLTKPRPYFKGGLSVALPPAVLIGSADCLEHGDTLPVTAARSLVSGIDSRCWSSQGLPVPTPPVWGPLIWMTPASLPALNDGDPVSLWSDTSGYKHHLVNGNTGQQPTLKLVSTGGLSAAEFARGHSLAWSTPVPVGTEHSIYFVGTISSTGFTFASGPSVAGTPQVSGAHLNTYDAGMGYTGYPLSPQLPYAGVRGKAYLFWARRLGSSADVGCHGLASGSVAIASTVAIALAGLLTSANIPVNLEDSFISELLVWPFKLDDAEHAAVISYLSLKYGV
jgi:hypothetical protein